MCEFIQFDVSQHCYEERCFKGAVTPVLSKNAPEWEGRTDACVEYKCDDESKRDIMISACVEKNGQRQMCINDMCKPVDSSLSVYINVDDGMNAADFTSDELAETIRKSTGIDVNTVGIELGDDGKVVRVIVFVDNEQSARMIVDVMNNLDKTKCN